MNFVWHNFKKDVQHLWLVVGLWLVATTAQTILGAIVPGLTGRPVLWNIYHMVSYLAPALQYLFLIVLIPLVIQQDPLQDPRAFWLTRPISRRTLLAGKILFLGVVIILPVVLGEVIVLACSGLAPRFVWLAIPEVSLEVAARTCVIGILAAFTLNFARFAITGVCYLIGIGITWLVANVWLIPLIVKMHVGHPLTPDLSTGMLQSQKMAAAVVTVLLGGVMLAWQYLTRKKKTAMALALFFALCVIAVSGVCPYLWSDKREVTPAIIAGSSGNLELTLSNIRLTESPIAGWKEAQTFKTDFSLQNKDQSTQLEIVGGQATLIPAGGSPRKGLIAFAMEVVLKSSMRSDYAARPFPSVLIAVMARDLGSVRVLNPNTNGVVSVTSLSGTLNMMKSDDYAVCAGQKVTVTGDVKVAAYSYKMAISPLQSGACLSFGLDADRVSSVDNEKATQINIRKRLVNLALNPEKNADTYKERMSPWQDTFYLLLNRKAGNEAILCEAVGSNDILSMMTLGLRMMSITRLDYCDVMLTFPPRTATWLKDAELVCFKKTRLGTLRRAIDRKDILVGGVETKADVTN